MKSSINNLAHILLCIKHRLIQHPVFILGAGVPIDDPAFVRCTDELDHLSQRLDLLLRELRTREHLLRARERNLWNVPRESRYAPASSVRQQQASVRDLSKEAVEIRKLLDDLLMRSVNVSEGDAADKIGGAVKEWFHSREGQSFAAHTSTTPGGLAYMPYFAGQLQASQRPRPSPSTLRCVR
ncbi:MAG: hypothetical protein WCC59_10165 [Terriglobales bacterium]